MTQPENPGDHPALSIWALAVERDLGLASRVGRPWLIPGVGRTVVSVAGMLGGQRCNHPHLLMGWLLYGCPWGRGVRLAPAAEAGPESSGNVTGLLCLPDPTLGLEGKRIKVNVKTNKEGEFPEPSEGASLADHRGPSQAVALKLAWVLWGWPISEPFHLLAGRWLWCPGLPMQGPLLRGSLELRASLGTPGNLSQTRCELGPVAGGLSPEVCLPSLWQGLPSSTLG